VAEFLGMGQGSSFGARLWRDVRRKVVFFCFEMSAFAPLERELPADLKVNVFLMCTRRCSAQRVKVHHCDGF